MNAIVGDGWFAVAKRKRNPVDHELLRLVQTGSAAAVRPHFCFDPADVCSSIDLS